MGCVRSRSALLAFVLAGALTSATPARADVWPTSHARVARALASADAVERRAAAGQIPSLPPELARTLAREALLDPDTQVKLHAAHAAARLGLERAGDIVVGWLSDLDVTLRVAACELIEASPTPASVQALARVLGDAHADVRKAAASAMGSSGMADAVSPLLGHLDDGSVAVRLEVVRALGRIGDGRAVVPLVSKLQDAEPDVRRAAARALGQLGDGRANATLMLALQDPSADVRIEVLEALGALDASEATTAIAALVAESRPGIADLTSGPVRDAALRALGRIGTPEAIKLLIGVLATEPGAAGVEPTPARRALVLAGAAAVEPLIATVNASASTRLASGAVLALGELGAKQSLRAIVRATQRGSVTLEAGLGALARLGDGAALPFVLEHVDDADPRVRQRVVEVASALLDPASSDGRAVDVVERRVSDARAPLGERLALIELLGRTGSPRAQRILLAVARTSGAARPATLALRVASVEALGVLGLSSSAVDTVLLTALSHDDARLRTAAARATARVGKDAAARRLLHMLGVSAEQDRGAIGIALSGALGRSREPALVAEVAEALRSASPTSRDALIEGLGRMPTPEAGALLAELARHASVDDRRKVAEALAGHPAQTAVTLTLTRDPSSGVRAAAVWSLGVAGEASAVAVLRPLLTDLDVGVAGNAAVALARVALRAKTPSDPPEAASVEVLCAGASDHRSYVRANALAGLRMLGATCFGEGVRRVLSRDPSWRARAAAADLLRGLGARAGQEGVLDRRALDRCVAEERDATVARHCAEGRAPSQGSESVLVYVVPNGRTSPTPRAPYALALADGSLRLGVADRRGSLFEHAAPSGPLRLAVPAALAP